MSVASKTPKTVLANEMGVSRRSMYYRPKMPERDWAIKVAIEEILREHPAYGHKRLACALKLNKKRILRVMHLFGLKPYRRRGKKWHKPKEKSDIYPNLLMAYHPTHEHHIWVADFTHIAFKGKWVYLATVMDLYTRSIVGFSVLTNHSATLVINALLSAVHHAPRPFIFHSDNGSEYDSEDFKTILQSLGVQISRSAPGCPWENGYQESFYGKFKVDLGDSDRFTTLGELVYEIYRTIYVYNNSRIHTALKMSPREFAQMHKLDTMEVLEEGVQ
jgi:transposase InsO family protein